MQLKHEHHEKFCASYAPSVMYSM
ncbi:putative elastase-1, partial [Trichinella spiralis]